MHQITNSKEFCAGFPWLLAEVEDLVDTDSDQGFREQELSLRKLIQKANDLLVLFVCCLFCDIVWIFLDFLPVVPAIVHCRSYLGYCWDMLGSQSQTSI